MKKIIRKVVKAILHFLLIIVYRVKIIGKENIPKEGAYIICGNHIHALDAAIVVLCAKRKIVFMAKAELFKRPFVGWLGNLFDMIPVKRDSKDIESMKKSLKVLKNNEILGIFPEGTRNGLEKTGKVKNGAAYLSLRTGIPVIPAGIVGQYKPFRKITLTYGKPLIFDEYKSKNFEKEDLEKVSQIIMDNIIKLTNVEN